MKWETASEVLITRYNKLMEVNKEHVQWAVHKKYEQTELVCCSVPLIGKAYFEQPKKVLVYASAEVLSDYYPGGESERPWLDDDLIAVNRHRWFFDNPDKQEGRFFPNIHIQPMNDGALMTAVGYVLTKLGLQGICKNPYQVCECICVGNYGKYTVETDHQRKLRTGEGEGISKRNIDTAENADALFASREFVKADFEILQPDYVIIPGEAYRTEKEFIDSISGDALVIPIYQMNSSNVNRIIHKKHSEYELENIPADIRRWYENLH